MVVAPWYGESWSALLLLIDYYSHLLQTMSVDEFFSTSVSAGRWNPLSLDELISFSRRLLNIAFPLYWFKGNIGVRNGFVLGILDLCWESVRDKVTRCLSVIHARE